MENIKVTRNKRVSIGRKFAKDVRDKNHLIKKILTTGQPIVASKYWDNNEWWGDQRDTPQCVGYAWAHWLEDGPITHKGTPPIVSPRLIYTEAKKVDEWPGQDYQGTSVRAGAKYLKAEGNISEYLWAWDVETLIITVLTKGPVVVGTNWYYNMFFPNRRGVITATGQLVGGHAYVINGVDTKTKLFRLKNSWGRKWGQRGSAYISFNDMTKLIRLDGEICLATENEF